MGFYKSFLIGVTIQLIILLAIMAVILSNKSKDQLFPSTISTCPDFYSLNPSGMCVMQESVYSSKSPDCMSKNTKDMALLAKKSWAARCGVAWDGITNSSNI